MRNDDPTYEEGIRVRREVLGDAHVDEAIGSTTELTTDFQEYITRAVWGSIWTREKLDRHTRSCITLAICTALGREAEVALHVRAARNNGLTDAEIAEVILHTAAYAGVPAANEALKVARPVIDELDAVG